MRVPFLLNITLALTAALDVLVSTLTVRAVEPPPPPALTLEEAAKAGNIARLEELLSQNTNNPAPPGFGLQALADAIRARQTQAVKCLIAHGVSIEGIHNSATPLTIAAIAGDLGIVDFLLESGANVNTPNQNGTTALMVAAGGGRMEVLKRLLERGAKINAVAPGVNEWSALKMAVFNNQPETVALLLARGAELFTNALFMPVSMGNLEVAKLLVARGVSINSRRLSHMSTRDRQDWETPIHAAAETGQTNIMAWLLAQGALIDDAGYNDATPLMYAIRGRHPDAARFLIEHGANINATNRSGQTPLVLVAWAGENMGKILQLLLARGADTQVEDRTGQTVMSIAMEFDRKSYVQHLLAAGAKPTAQALLNAARMSDAEGMSMLIKAGLDVNATNRFGHTALMMAAAGGREENVRWLLKKGADKGFKNKDGETAAQAARTEKIKRLLRQ